MRKRESVTSIMTATPISVSINDDLTSAKEKMYKAGVRHLPVVSGDDLVGIISNNDIERLSFGEVFENQGDADQAILQMLSIKQVMTANPKTVSTDTTIKEVAEILAKEHFHSLPVTEKSRVVGIVTSTDIINYLLAQY